MEVTSAEVHKGATIKNEQVFKGFGCTGDNISPSLSWTGAPKGTKSFAITVYDPDAPTGSGWWHWVVFNIPASTTSIPKNAGDVNAKLMPEGAIQSRTDFGADGYGGPCPPKGAKPHHYHFTVFAVDVDKLPDAADHNASGGAGRLRPAFPYAGEGELHWALRPLKVAVGICFDGRSVKLRPSSEQPTALSGDRDFTIA